MEELECRNLLSTLMVLSNADSGPGSLRDTLAAAQNGDIITFDASLDGETITLTGGELAFDQSLRIEGPGADQLKISSNNSGRVFDLTGSGADVTIAGLTIAGRLAAQGGGIEDDAANLTLRGVNLSSNQAVGAAGTDARGGGVFIGSAASLRVIDSVFSNNVARGGDGLGGSSAGPRSPLPADLVVTRRAAAQATGCESIVSALRATPYPLRRVDMWRC